jgi:hypothetical protein
MFMVKSELEGIKRWERDCEGPYGICKLVFLSSLRTALASDYDIHLMFGTLPRRRRSDGDGNKDEDR